MVVDDTASPYNDRLVQEMYPVIAKHINDHGGVAYMKQLQKDPDVIRLKSQLPKDDNRYLLGKIVANEPNYFTIVFDHEAVATAVGYQNGHLNLEGSLTPSGIEHVKEQKYELQRKAAIKEQAISRPAMFGGELEDMGDKIFDAIMHCCDRDFEATVRDARRCRSKLYGSNVPPPQSAMNDPNWQDRKRPRPADQHQHEKITLSDVQAAMMERMLRICVKELEKEPTLDLTLTSLANHPMVTPLKSALQGASFSSLFTTCYPDYFSTYHDDSNGGLHICLTNYPPEGNLLPTDLPLKPII